MLRSLNGSSRAPEPAGRLGHAGLRREQNRGARYHTAQRCSDGRTIGPPGLQENASLSGGSRYASGRRRELPAVAIGRLPTWRRTSSTWNFRACAVFVQNASRRIGLSKGASRRRDIQVEYSSTRAPRVAGIVAHLGEARLGLQITPPTSIPFCVVAFTGAALSVRPGSVDVVATSSILVLQYESFLLTKKKG
jgi:hypothetical protein